MGQVGQREAVGKEEASGGCMEGGTRGVVVRGGLVVLFGDP